MIEVFKMIVFIVDIVAFMTFLLTLITVGRKNNSGWVLNLVVVILLGLNLISAYL